jgi:hypothetical protein
LVCIVASSFGCRNSIVSEAAMLVWIYWFLSFGLTYDFFKGLLELQMNIIL